MSGGGREEVRVQRREGGLQHGLHHGGQGGECGCGGAAHRGEGGMGMSE